MKRIIRYSAVLILMVFLAASFACGGGTSTDVADTSYDRSAGKTEFISAVEGDYGNMLGAQGGSAGEELDGFAPPSNSYENRDDNSGNDNAQAAVEIVEPDLYFVESGTR